MTQLNVRPEFRRHLVAAALLQAQFDRSAYGCRLFCCWCAQHLAANEFWAAMGFTPIAFRTGVADERPGEGRACRAADSFVLAETREGGRHDHAVVVPGQDRRRGDARGPTGVPHPPGMHWRDVLPVRLPTGDAAADELPALPPSPKSRIVKRPKVPPVPVRPAHVPKGGHWFAPEVEVEPEPTAEEIAAEKVRLAAQRNAYRAAVAARRGKLDGRLIEMARELRDHWAEQADAVPALPGKHDVRKTAIGAAASGRVIAIEHAMPFRPALPTAA